MPAVACIREYPQRVTSAETPESREADSPDQPAVRQMGATYGFGRFVVAPLARPSTARTSRARRTCRGPGRSSSRAITCRSSTRSRSRSPHPGRCTSSPSRATSTGPACRDGSRAQFFTAIGAVPVQARCRAGGAGRARPAATAAGCGQRGRAVSRRHPIARRPAVQGPHRRRVPRAADRRTGRAGRPDRHRQGDARRRPVPLADPARHGQVRRAARPRPPRRRRVRQGAAPRDRRHHGGHPRPVRPGTCRTPTTRLPRTTRSSGSGRSSRTSGASAHASMARPRSSARAGRGSSPSSR